MQFGIFYEHQLPKPWSDISIKKICSYQGFGYLAASAVKEAPLYNLVFKQVSGETDFCKNELDSLHNAKAPSQ